MSVLIAAAAGAGAGPSGLDERVRVLEVEVARLQVSIGEIVQVAGSALTPDDNQTR